MAAWYTAGMSGGNRLGHGFQIERTSRPVRQPGMKAAAKRLGVNGHSLAELETVAAEALRVAGQTIGVRGLSCIDKNIADRSERALDALADRLLNDAAPHKGRKRRRNRHSARDKSANARPVRSVGSAPKH